MKIYIGFDYDKTPMGVLLADSQDKAEIAWAAMADTPHTIEEIDPSIAKGVNGLVFLLTSTKVNSRTDFGYRDFGVDFRLWHRGVSSR